MKKANHAEGVTRRDFVKGATAGSLALGLGLSLPESTDAASLFNAKNPQSKLVLIRNEKAVAPDGKVDAEVVGAMLDEAMASFTGEKGTNGWTSLFKPADKIGLKITECRWMRLPTEDAVTNAVRDRLISAGISKKQIDADDHGLRPGKFDALINIPSVKVHTLTGIAAAVKNYINFSRDLMSYHHDGNGRLGEIWNFDEVKGKTRLIVVDLLKPYCGKGPQINPLHRWNYGGLLVGTDPIAIDTVCLAICQSKRDQIKKEPWPISPPALFLKAGVSKYKLGTNDPAKIDLTRLGWEKGRLV